MKAADVLEPFIREVAYNEAIKAIEERAEDLKRPKFISLDVAKRDYGLHGATLYRKIKAKTLNLYTLGGKSLLKRSEVEALIVQCSPRKRAAFPKEDRHWKSKGRQAGKPDSSDHSIEQLEEHRRK